MKYATDTAKKSRYCLQFHVLQVNEHHEGCSILPFYIQKNLLLKLRATVRCLLFQSAIIQDRRIQPENNSWVTTLRSEPKLEISCLKSKWLVLMRFTEQITISHNDK